MKAMCRVTLMMAAVALLAISVPVHASTMDDRIESTARDSYVFKTYLKSDDIKIQSRDGVVTLTGIVSEEYHKITLLYHRSTSALKAKVETRRGVVTLSGKASNAAEVSLATKLEDDINGVKSVKNLMTIE
jgi:hyperosmotically inducible protein